MPALPRNQKPPRSIRAALRVCPYRSLIGPPATDIGFSFVAIGGEPEPMPDDALQAAIDTILSGRTVLLAAERPDLRAPLKQQMADALALLAVPAARA